MHEKGRDLVDGGTGVVGRGHQDLGGEVRNYRSWRRKEEHRHWESSERGKLRILAYWILYVYDLWDLIVFTFIFIFILSLILLFNIYFIELINLI
jgi:hypothetical protein